MFPAMNGFYVAAPCVLVVGLILHIVGLATPNWSVNKYNSGYKSGLWQSCDPDDCHTYTDAIIEIQACEGLALCGMLVGFFSLIIALIIVIMPSARKYGNHTLPKLVFVAAVLAMTCVIVGGALWATKAYEKVKRDTNPDPRLGYSFALSIAGGLIMGIGGGLAFFGGYFGYLE